ncbi:MAG TPA: NUDIX hydrolase [Candidatus Paceibacterota bacterium]
MEIKLRVKTRTMGEVDVHYHDIESYDDVKDLSFESIGAVCITTGGELVLVYDKSRERWTPIGGKLEAGESLAAATEREVKEESNMKVLKQIPIGYQTVFEPHRTIHQSRTLCIVEPYGPFVADPDGDITEIKLVDRKDYKKHFDYGEVQDHIMRRIEEVLSRR